MRKLIFLVIALIIILGCETGSTVITTIDGKNVTIQQYQECKNVSYQIWELNKTGKIFVKENNTWYNATNFISVIKYRLECKNIQKFNITIGNKTEDVDFRSFGNCKIDKECIICDSNVDGNADGICQSGESCIKNCYDKGTLVSLQKNSRNDFVITDKSFSKYLTKLIPKSISVVEVSK